MLLWILIGGRVMNLARERHRDYLLATVQSLAIPEERFRTIAESTATPNLESIRQEFGNAAPWWREPQRDLPRWGRRLPESLSFRLITQVVPDALETVWFLAIEYGEQPLLFES